MANTLALSIYEHGERTDSLRDAASLAQKCGFPIVIMPVFCRDEAQYIRIIKSREELLKYGGELLKKSRIGEIYVNPYRQIP